MSDPQPDYDSVPDWLCNMWANDLRDAVEGNREALGITDYRPLGDE